ncbi:non-ribosomal peptide synthetase [Planomonospora sp. ID67723]|uniref:non-ribosomal peptide synthetase n=1 Tax=Planomonospora sp. ID67723 TaxID=2738134 RepID=UPI0018C3F698|nr:non-ribosomal peptide synthetase [Planomonospora sp. ID67723]
MGESQLASVDDVLACLADVLERRAEEIDPDTGLTELGLESFTAVRLRRRLREDVGLDLPLTAFLGSATARTVAAGTVPDADAFPLTPIQAAYLVGRDPAFPLGGVATFYYQEFDRTPEGDPEADLAGLAAAWNRLVRRHPMLRMVVGPDARQSVLEEVPDYAIATTDLRLAAPDAVDEALRALRAECSHQLRPTDRWPLFDLRAALLPDGRTRLFIGVDVLALDLMSWMRLMREWGAFVADPGLEPPAPPLTFADLVRRRLDDPAERRRREAAAAYWERRAPALPDGPTLPWTRGPAELGVPHFTRHGAELDAEQWAQLRKQAASHGLSPTGLLLAAFSLVLQRWGGHDSFCLNTTLFDRDDFAIGDETPGLDTVIGDFTSTVLVEIPAADPGGWYGFAGYAAAVNRRFWEDMDHRAVSGMEALRAATESGQRARTTDPATGLPVPVHPVVFTSGIGLAGEGEAPAAWLGTEVFGVSQTPQVLLDHIVHDEDGRLRIAWDAVDGALPHGFVDGMLAAHVRLLRLLAADPAAWSDPTLGWDPSFHRDESLPGGAFGGAGPLLDDPLREAAVREPSAPALLDATARVDAGSLAERAARTGRALAGAGLGPGDLVAVLADKGIAQVTALLGVLAGGAGYVPVEPSWPRARVTALCEQAGVRHALAAPGTDVSVWPEEVTVHRLDADGTLALPEEAEPRRPAPDDLAYVIFTSGSTGRPKGVAIEHRAARTTLDDLARRFPLHSGDRVLALSAFSFDLSVYDIFSLLGEGGAVVLPDVRRQRDPGHWLELMARHGVTVWNTAPALLEMLVEYAELEPETVRRALSSLRLVFLSADWIPVTLPDRLRVLAPQAQVVSLGGATEASIWSICHPVGEVDPSWPSIPYGRALRGQSFQILDPQGRPCPVGVPGELHIGGDGLARGYVGDPAQTAERFITHPVLGRRLYRTGDLGRWRYDGTIEFLGRLDRQVKIRGHRIELGEIESTLDRLPSVRQAVARAVPGPDDRPRLVCYYVPADPGAPPADDALIEALRADLPSFMVPNRFLVMDAFPITANGKIDYAALPNPYQRGAQTAPEPAQVPGTVQAPAPAPVLPHGASVLPHGASAHPHTAPASPAADAGLTGLLLAGGLDVRLAVSGGTLSPSDSLAAAGDWARRVKETLAAHGLTAIERLPADGLIEFTVAAGRGEGLAGDTAPTGSTVPAPGAMPASGTAVPGGALAAGATTAPTAPTAVFPAAAVPVPAPGPDPQVERAVARVFSELLNAPVDVTTPFFRLGASSLTVVLAHRRLRAELDDGLTVVDLFARPTVRELAAFITARREGGVQEPPAALDAAPASGPVPAPDTAPAPAEESPGRAESRRAARARAAELAR